MIVYNKLAAAFSPNPHQILWKEISPHLGRGLFARESLPANTLLWEEAPLLTASSLQELVRSIASSDDFTKFDQLCRPDTSNESVTTTSKEEGVAYCNHFCVRPDLYLLFSHISLLNHSCHPNVAIVLQEQNKEENGPVKAKVQTVRDVDPGEELVLSYLGSETLFADASTRQHVLQSRWGFSCHCERCQWNKTNNDPKKKKTAHPIWSLWEKAAAMADANKPRTASVDPNCLALQQEASRMVEQHFPYLKEAERFQADVLYFS